MNSYWNDVRVVPPSITVMEQEKESEWSGLLDQHGNKLMRVQKKEKIGFVVFTEGEER